MSLELPFFNYHPAPILTGSVVAEKIHCLCCKQLQSHTYVGPVEADEDLTDSLCPWCIQNGQAHARYKAIFTSPDEIGNFKHTFDLPVYVQDEICYRTPGFYGWQESKWWVHCGDAALFLGIVGAEEIEQLGAQALKSLKSFFPDWAALQFLDFYAELSSENSPSAYLFQCRACGEYGLYADEEQAPA